jgi:hypothetical protein
LSKETIMKRLVILALVLACAAGIALASDHQDTPDVELNPSMDMTDLYVFPSPTPGRVARSRSADRALDDRTART